MRKDEAKNKHPWRLWLLIPAMALAAVLTLAVLQRRGESEGRENPLAILREDDQADGSRVSPTGGDDQPAWVPGDGDADGDIAQSYAQEVAQRVPRNRDSQRFDVDASNPEDCPDGSGVVQLAEEPRQPGLGEELALSEGVEQPAIARQEEVLLASAEEPCPLDPATPQMVQPSPSTQGGEPQLARTEIPSSVSGTDDVPLSSAPQRQERSTSAEQITPTAESDPLVQPPLSPAIDATVTALDLGAPSNNLRERLLPQEVRRAMVPSGDAAGSLIPENQGVTPPDRPQIARAPLVAGDLTLSTPLDHSYYRSLVSVSGSAPGFESLEWDSPQLGPGGRISLNANGDFEFNINAVKISEDVEVIVQGVDRNGEEQLVTLRLYNDWIGPELVIQSPRNNSFYTREILIEGQVGAGPFDPEGVGEIESLQWSLGGGSRTPVFFDSDGSFQLSVEIEDKLDVAEVELAAIDLNGNETLRVLQLRDGALPPELILDGADEGIEYGAGVRLAGLVIDPYAGELELGGIESLSFEILSSEAVTRDGLVTGQLQVREDGSFNSIIPTAGLIGNQDVAIIAEGRNGQRVIRTFRIRQGQSPIPDFKAIAGNGSLRTEWSPVPTATSYAVILQTSLGQSVRYGTRNPGLDLRGLSNGTEYTLTVEADTPSGAVLSHEVAAMPLSPATLRPSVQGEFRRIRVSWSPVPGADRYAIFRADNPEGPFEPIGETSSDGYYVDTQVFYGRDYWYSVAPASYTEVLSTPDSGRSLAVQQENVEFVGGVDVEKPNGITIEGNYALIAAEESGFVLIDVSEPARPISVGNALIPGAKDVDVEGIYAYVATGEAGLKVVNINDPARPLVVSTRRAGNAVAVQVSGNHAYIADVDRGLRVLDIEDALEPKRLASTEGLSGRDIAVRGDTAYLATGDSGVRIFDISVPERPWPLGTISFDSADVLYLMGDILVMGGESAGFALYDVSDATSPQLLSSVEGFDVVRIAESDGFLVVASQTNLRLYDIDNPQQPESFRQYPIRGTTALAVLDDELLVASEGGVDVYQTYLVGVSFVTGEAQLEGLSYAVELDETSERLIVSSHSGGVTAVDPRRLDVLASWSSAFAEGASSAFQGVFVADGGAGLRYIRTDGEEDILFEENQYVHDVVFFEGTAFAATDSGLVAFSEADGAVVRLGTAELNQCLTVEEHNGLIYAGGADRLAVYAPFPDRPPLEVATYPLTGVRSVSVVGSQVAALSDTGVHLLEFDSGGRFEEIGAIATESGEGVFLDGQYLYVASGYQGLQVYDIRKPGKWRIISSCPDVFALDVTVQGETAYVADGEGIKTVGIYIPDWLK